MGMVGHFGNQMPCTVHPIQIGNSNAVFVFTQNTVSKRFNKIFVRCRIDFSKRDRLVIGNTFLWSS